MQVYSSRSVAGSVTGEDSSFRRYMEWKIVEEDGINTKNIDSFPPLMGGAVGGRRGRVPGIANSGTNRGGRGGARNACGSCNSSINGEENTGQKNNRNVVSTTATVDVRGRRVRTAANSVSTAVATPASGKQLETLMETVTISTPSFSGGRGRISPPPNVKEAPQRQKFSAAQLSWSGKL